MAGERIKEEPMLLQVGIFHGREGLKIPCAPFVEGCEGIIQVRRDPLTLNLQPTAYCVLCGQEFYFGTDRTGLELEMDLRGVRPDPRCDCLTPMPEYPLGRHHTKCPTRADRPAGADVIPIGERT